MQRDVGMSGIFRQLYSFVFVGFVSNLVVYGAYILLAGLWESPKVVMSVLYVLGALIGFFGNRKFTFQHDGCLHQTGVRYVVVQICGYLINLTLLILFVDFFGFEHQLVQAFAIIVVAIFLFIMSRIYVFSCRNDRRGAIES